jgi:hypothetical protein
MQRSDDRFGRKQAILQLQTQGNKTMTNDTKLLNDTELADVSGGGGLITLSSRTSNIVLPHIPQAKDLLTQEQIQKLLSPSFNPPIKFG